MKLAAGRPGLMRPTRRCFAYGHQAALQHADEALFDIALLLFESDDVKLVLPASVDALKAGKPRPTLLQRPINREELTMNKLLAEVIEAHGGLDRWSSLNLGEATIVTGGGLWGLKGLVQDANPRRMTVSLHEERASVNPFGDPDWHTQFTPERIAIVRSDGSVVKERMNPRASFAGHSLDTPWDPLHRAYFNGYAMWTYLTTPFLFTMEGVRVQEVEPWTEGSRNWRVLRVEFPDSIATHSRIQDFYLEDDRSLRRHDYHVDVAGGFAAAQIVHDYIEADGIRLPSKRRAYLRGPDHRPSLDVLLVSIDISDVRFT